TRSALGCLRPDPVLVSKSSLSKLCEHECANGHNQNRWQNQIAYERRPNFSDRADCGIAFDPSNRHLSQAQVTSDGRETRSMAGGPIHFGNVTPRGRCSLAGADRMGDRSRLDGLVLSLASKLVEMDRSRCDCYCLRAAGVDLALPREELDRYSRHTTRAHLGHTRSLSLGPASLLRLRRIARCGGFPDGGKLVPLCDRRRAVLSVHHPNADRRRESACSLWK